MRKYTPTKTRRYVGETDLILRRSAPIRDARGVRNALLEAVGAKRAQHDGRSAHEGADLVEGEGHCEWFVVGEVRGWKGWYVGVGVWVLRRLRRCCGGDWVVCA
jgi:hypothetical protein